MIKCTTSFLSLNILFFLLTGCNNDFHEEDSQVISTLNDTTKVIINPGVFIEYDNSGNMLKQVLISPLGDTLHKICYNEGRIDSSFGEYFYTRQSLISDPLDSLASVEFIYNYVLPDTSLYVNICVYEFDQDSNDFVQIHQLYASEYSDTLVVQFSNERPKVYSCLWYLYKSNNKEYQFVCQTPFQINPREF